MAVFKISSKSKPQSVAGAIANTVKTTSKVELQCVGAGALNQAIKAVSIARGYAAPTGKDLIVIPSFNDVVIDGEERTSIRLIVEVR